MDLVTGLERAHRKKHPLLPLLQVLIERYRSVVPETLLPKGLQTGTEKLRDFGRLLPAEVWERTKSGIC